MFGHLPPMFHFEPAVNPVYRPSHSAGQPLQT